MQIHVKKGEISQLNANKLSSIMSRGQKQWGRLVQRTKSGKCKEGHFRKSCPVPGSDKIVVNVGRHLSASKEHNITKGSSHYIRLLKMAKRYTGTAELQVYLETETPKSEEDDKEEESQSKEENDHADNSSAEEKTNHSSDEIDVDVEHDNEDSEEDDHEDCEEDDNEDSGEDEQEDSEESEDEDY